MKATQQESTNPLGLSLDFMFGRGYLWARRQRLSDWIALESLRMEIPDLQFPFDARGGLDRFRHTRCLVREVEFAISEVGLGDLLQEAVSHLDGYEQLEVRFLEGAAHVSVKLSAFGADSYLSFRAALIPPEPARADEVHLSLYDYRVFGPLPYPARLVVHELLTGLLNTPVLRSSGRGQSFTVKMAGDIISFRPLKLLFLKIFPKVGWKLPNLAGVILESAHIRPGVLTIRAIDDDPQAGGPSRGGEFELAASKEGGRALAAYEAKELFSHADRALFDGELRQALSLLANYRDVYGLHPALVARLFDCLIADGSPANLASAESLRRELVAEDPDDLQAALAWPLISIARRRDEEAAEGFEALSGQLEDRRQTRDWILCELALAGVLADDDPEGAAARLRQVLKRDPRHRAALEMLRTLYDRIGEPVRLEETLKRLTGVYSDRETLTQTYLELARHLMDRQGDLAEARMYLEKVLRLDGESLKALEALGESYVLGDEPLRALKAFGSAARIAESRQREELASRLLFRVSQLWLEEMEDPRQALLGLRRSLALSSEDGAFDGQRARKLQQAAAVCEELSRDDEAMKYWSEAVALLERTVERSSPTFDGDEPIDENPARDALTEAHRRLAAIYERRDRPAVAASHMRRVLEIEPRDKPALEWMENFLRRAGQPRELIELYDDLLAGVDSQAAQLVLVEKLGDLYAGTGGVDEAHQYYRRALEIDPGTRAVRKKLVELLTEEQRFEALCDVLNSVLVRTRDRSAQHEISMEIGATAEAMGEPERAIRSYLEAAKTEIGDLEALQGARRVLEKLVETRGAAAKAPVGSTTAGELLEKLSMQLAELVPSVIEQRELLLKVAMLADERGDTAAAAEARERAQHASQQTGDDGEYEDVDSRLDAMLDEFESDDAELFAEYGEPSGIEPKSKERQSEEPSGEEVESFRERFSTMIKQPAELSTSDDEPLRSKLRSVMERSSSESEKNEEDRQDEIEDASSPASEESSITLPVPTSVAEQMDAPTREAILMDAKLFAEDSEGDTSPRIHPVEMGINALNQVRGGGNSRDVAEAIEHVLSLAENTDTEVLDPEEKKSLCKEAGEIFYYDLEDGDSALPYLEAVHQLDPEGDGASPAVINALEKLYEERGEVGARIRLLKARLNAEESPQMKTTYRLLLAQLVWGRRDDAEGARKWLDEVLAEEPTHEAAHRLLADICRAQKRWQQVVEHLEVIVRNASGGIDEVEAQRELAEVLLHRLDDPDRAIEYFERVIEESPGDSQALAGIKKAQALQEDWTGYVESLARELGLLTGRSEGFSLQQLEELQPDAIPDVLRASVSEIIADAAHIVEEELQNLESARTLWALAYRLQPEQVEALQRRIELDRRLGVSRDLAEGLVDYADMLLDPVDRYHALVEAAGLRADELDEAQGAYRLYEEALNLVHEMEQNPKNVDAIRQRIEGLQATTSDPEERNKDDE